MKSYTLIWECCSMAMKNKISNWKDFKETIYDNTIKLLCAIKEHALIYQEYKYSMAIIADRVRNLLRTRQKENKNLKEFMKRFRTAEEIFQSHNSGSLIIPKAVREHPNFEKENNPKVNMTIGKDIPTILGIHIPRTVQSTKVRIIVNKLEESAFTQQQNIHIP